MEFDLAARVIDVDTDQVPRFVVVEDHAFGDLAAVGAFTKHGAVMLARVLNSPVAVVASIQGRLQMFPDDDIVVVEVDGGRWGCAGQARQRRFG